MEYKVVRAVVSDMEKELNEHGKDGWVLAFTHHITGNNYLFILSKESAPKRGRPAKVSPVYEPPFEEK